MKKPTQTERAGIVDELGQLDQDIAPLKDKEKRASALRAEIRAWYPKLLPAGTITEQGFKFFAAVGAMGNERSIPSMKAVFSAIGQAKFLEYCSMTLKALGEALDQQGNGDIALLVEEARTGARPVKTYAVARAGK